MSGINIGDRFHALTVLSVGFGVRPSGKKKYICECSCDCGEVITVETCNLASGNTKKCTNCAVISRAEKRSKHKASMSYKDKNPELYSCYTRWQAIKRRCYKEGDSHYKNYGARGIKMCDRWINSFENFLIDMGLPPTRKHQIDRIDNNGDYEPKNCRWVVAKVNARNKSNNRVLEAKGLSMTLVAWAEKTGIKRETISMRIKRGWSIERALGY